MLFHNAYLLPFRHTFHVFFTQMLVPGLDPADIDVNFTKGVLYVKGYRGPSAEEMQDMQRRLAAAGIPVTPGNVLKLGIGR
jgi:hypothetical protein